MSAMSQRWVRVNAYKIKSKQNPLARWKDNKHCQQQLTHLSHRSFWNWKCSLMRCLKENKENKLITKCEQIKTKKKTKKIQLNPSDTRWIIILEKKWSNSRTLFTTNDSNVRPDTNWNLSIRKVHNSYYAHSIESKFLMNELGRCWLVEKYYIHCDWRIASWYLAF